MRRTKDRRGHDGRREPRSSKAAVLTLTCTSILCIDSAFAQSSGVHAEIDTFSLYRSSLADPAMKVRIATFDSLEGKDYNFENCWIAANLFAGQEGAIVKYWCEPDLTPERAN